MQTITISDGVTYEPKASTHGVPAGCLTISGVHHYMRPFIAPTMIKGHEFRGCAAPIGGKGNGANISKRVWLLMLDADRKAAGVVEDVAATYNRCETERKTIAAQNAARSAQPRTLSEQQVKERDYDRLHNEGAYGYNPHRFGDRPTYWSPADRRERHYPEGA